MPQKALKILLVSASEMEMINNEPDTTDTLVTGVGMVATTHLLTKQLITSNYHLVIDLGIAGSFNPAFKIGDVVQVISDRLVELGVEDNGKFVPANEMNLITTEEMTFETDLRVNKLPEANGITVNKVHGSSESIQNVREQFNPDVEGMEGAAVAYVCKQFDVPWVQIRAISNKVEPRNRAAWDIGLAIKNLHQEVEHYLDMVKNEA